MFPSRAEEKASSSKLVLINEQAPLCSSGWPLPSESNGFIMINKFHLHRGKGTMSAQTESKEASLQMLISKHALLWHHRLDTRLSGKMWTGAPGTLRGCWPHWWPPVLRAAWRSPEEEGRFPGTSAGRMGNARWTLRGDWPAPGVTLRTSHPCQSGQVYNRAPVLAVAHSPLVRNYGWTLRRVHITHASTTLT